METVKLIWLSGFSKSGAEQRRDPGGQEQQVWLLREAPLIAAAAFMQRAFNTFCWPFRRGRATTAGRHLHLAARPRTSDPRTWKNEQVRRGSGLPARSAGPVCWRFRSPDAAARTCGNENIRGVLDNKHPLFAERILPVEIVYCAGLNSSRSGIPSGSPLRLRDFDNKMCYSGASKVGYPTAQKSYRVLYHFCRM